MIRNENADFPLYVSSAQLVTLIFTLNVKMQITFTFSVEDFDIRVALVFASHRTVHPSHTHQIGLTVA